MPLYEVSIQYNEVVEAASPYEAEEIALSAIEDYHMIDVWVVNEEEDEEDD